MNQESCRQFVDEYWRSEMVPKLIEYIRIPNQSPLFDPDWERHGHMERAVKLAYDWVCSRSLPGAAVEILRLEGRTNERIGSLDPRRTGW